MRMKIAHVVAAFPPRLGGMGVVAEEECRALSKRGHNVTIFTLHYSNTQSAQREYGFVQVLKSPLKLGDAGLVPQLLWHLRGFDLIHLHYPFYGGAEWAALASRFFNIPLVITVHMEAATSGIIKKSVQTLYDTLVSPVIISRAAQVIALNQSHFLATSLGRSVSEKKWQVIPNGVDTAQFSPHPVDWQNFPFPELRSKKIVLFVGNLIPFKRLDLLIKAFSQVYTAVPDARLLVVGGGYAEADYRALVKTTGLEKEIVFAGQVSSSEFLNQYYNAATCTVIPADQGESFSLVLSESLAAGCPVVVSAIPGLADRITDNVEGLLFKPGNAMDLAEKIITMVQFTTEKRQSLGAAGRQKMSANFSWDSHIAKLESLYYSVTGQKNS